MIVDAEPLATAHLWVGGLLVALAASGLLHLAGGRPALDASTHDLVPRRRRARPGRGRPARLGLAPWGAALVLAAVGARRRSSSSPASRCAVAAESTANGVRPAGHGHQRRAPPGPLAPLLPAAAPRPSSSTATPLDRRPRHRRRRLDDEDAAPLVHVFDQDVDGGASPSPAAPQPARPEAAPRPTPVQGTQLDLELGPAAKALGLEAAAANLLERSGTQSVDKAAVEAAGRVPRGGAGPARRRDPARRHGRRARPSPATSSSSAPA